VYRLLHYILKLTGRGTAELLELAQDTGVSGEKPAFEWSGPTADPTRERQRGGRKEREVCVARLAAVSDLVAQDPATFRPGSSC